MKRLSKGGIVISLLYQVNQEELFDLLIMISGVRPVFIWGAPGIGKSAIVESFADYLGMECVSLLGSQLAPEDIIGIPQIQDDVSVFFPPKMIAKKEPYVLFLDELNACSQEVQKAFYSLVHERRIGEYHLPKDTIVIAAGNRMEDSAIVKNMSSALLNRMIHVELKVDVKAWLKWAGQNEIHPKITQYIQIRKDHLWDQPSKIQEPYSTPRSWHMLSDALKAYGNDLDEHMLKVLTHGCLSANHANMFIAFMKQENNHNLLNEIIKGNKKLPHKLEERDLLYFLVISLKNRLVNELPKEKKNLKKESEFLVSRSKQIIVDLSRITKEMVQLIIHDEEKPLPQWFLVEVAKVLGNL